MSMRDGKRSINVVKRRQFSSWRQILTRQETHMSRNIKINVPVEGKPTANKTIVVDDSTLTPVVDRLAELKSFIDGYTAETNQIRSVLDKDMTEVRDRTESEGQFCKHVHVKGTACDARYTFKDAYATVDISNLGDLKRLLGKHFDRLFVVDKVVKIKDVDKLMKFLGDEILNYLHVEDVVVPVCEFRKVRFEARPDLSDAQNVELDRVVKAVSNKPTLNIK